MCGASEAWIAHPADRLNVARALFAPAVLFAPFVFPLPGGYELPYAALAFTFIGDTNYILHLHIHRPFAKNRAFNTILDLSMGAVTGMTSSNWRIQHLYGHHRGFDLPYRAASKWELERYSPLRALSFSACTIWQTFYAPLAESFRKGILTSTRNPINYRWAFAEQALSVALVASLLYVRPAMTLGYLLPWYFVTYFISRYVDYLNHYGCDELSDNVFDRANNSLAWGFNRAKHNFGYHLAHHIHPTAHWTDLPAIHQQIADKIPKRRLKSFSWSFLLMPYHFYLSRLDRT
jgi:fatty acid desaturase